MSEQPSDPRENELRGLIAANDARTSAAHDDAVLAAARDFTQRPPQRMRRVAPYAIAASVILAAGLTLLLYRPAPEEDTLRSTNQGLERLVTPRGGATLTAAPTEFRWPAQSGASTYRVTLRDATAGLIWTSAATAEPRAERTGATQIPLTSQTYYWSVEVEGAGGSRTLGPFWFRLQQ